MGLPGKQAHVMIQSEGACQGGHVESGGTTRPDGKEVAWSSGLDTGVNTEGGASHSPAMTLNPHPLFPRRDYWSTCGALTRGVGVGAGGERVSLTEPGARSDTLPGQECQLGWR